MPDRRISIVVPSYNRARYLDLLLTSLTWSAVGPDGFEVIVVNDGGTDDLAVTVDRGRRAGLDVRLVTLRTGGGPRNNARARNAGLATARYPIVLQTDPDIVFVDDVLAAVRDGVDGASLCSCDGYFPLTQAATEAIVFAGGARPTAAALGAAAEGRPNQVDSPDGVGGLHGAFACATEVLRSLGGYDESFDYWGWEDRELLVTAAARGLRRRWMRRTKVVHLWHPAVRGELGRETLAARGRVSQAAWDVQMQRAAAEYPRPGRTRPVARPPRTDHPGPVPYDRMAYERWRSTDDAQAFAVARVRLDEGLREAARAGLPRVFQMHFDALCGEADVLASLGHVALAREVVCAALARPWEPKQDLPAADETGHPAIEIGNDGDGPAATALVLYARIVEALERLAWYEHALGRVESRDRVLDVLADSEEGGASAAAIRVRLALVAGDRQAAVRALPALDDHRRTAAQEALALECLLLDGRDGAARARLPQVARAAEAGDYFDRLRLHAYARLLLPDGAPGGVDRAAADRSEFLFSVGVRSQRAGLDVAAWQLFQAFLEAGGPAEPRLRTECTARLAEAEARIYAVAGRTVAERLCGPAIEAAVQVR